MEEPFERVRLADKEILLLGTAHVSEKSVNKVLELIENEKPDRIALELDKARFEQLVKERSWREADVFEVVRKGKAYVLLFSLVLSSMQRKLGKQLGVKPGSEMFEAAKVAEQKGISIALVDRDIGITMKRALASMSIFEKLKLLFQLLLYSLGFGEKISKEEVEKLKSKDVLSMVIQELAREFPSMKAVLVDERDSYIAQKLKNLKAKKVLAVIGAGHLYGIKENLKKDVDITKLDSLPKSRNYALILKVLLPLALILLIAFGVYFKGAQFALSAFLIWFFVNAIFSSIGAIIARAHWKSVLAAFISAPLTSLHPALAAGWFAGLMEARARPVRVLDLEDLNKIDSLSDFQKNRFAHVLLVIALVNAGSTIATFLSLYLIATML